MDGPPDCSNIVGTGPGGCVQTLTELACTAQVSDKVEVCPGTTIYFDTFLSPPDLVHQMSY